MPKGGSNERTEAKTDRAQQRRASTNVNKRTHLGALLQVQGRALLIDEGNYLSYAGPLTASAAGKCVRYGGVQGSSPVWISPFDNCG
jgi:hypothetical protein